MLDAYLTRDAQVRTWFPGAVTDHDHLADWPGREHTWPRAELVEILDSALTQRAAPRAALANVSKLAKTTTLAVVSGQQPGYGVGPLFCLLKAAHSIALARRISAAGTPCVPIFWCAGDDHDLDETGHVDLIRDNASIGRLHAGYPHRGHPLTRQPARTGWDALITTADAELGAGPGRAWWQAHAPSGDETLPAWTCRILEQLFAADGLICVEARQLRPLWTNTLSHVVDSWPTAALKQRRSNLSEAGHGDPLGDLSEPPIFAETADGRQAVAAKDLSMALATPANLSPGAGLRPILQQAVLPAVAFCAGPGELRYHAAIGPLYAAAAVPAPVLIPRLSRTVIAPHIARGISNWQTTPSDWLGSTPPDLPQAPSMPAALAQSITALRNTLDALATQAGAHPKLGATIDASNARLKREVNRLQRSMERHLQRAADLPAPGILHASLRPRTQPQERILSCFQAIWQWGPGLVTHLLDAADTPAPWEHRAITL